MGKNNDPLAKAEEVGQQVFEAVASGLTEVVSRLQALAEQIEQKVEEQLRTAVGTPAPASKASKASKAAKGSKAAKASKAKKPAAKVSGAKKSAGKPKTSKPAVKAKAGAKKAGKSAAKKPAAKKTSAKKPAAKKTPAKKPAKKSASKAASGPTRDDLYKEASKLDVAGRSGMTKSQLVSAIAKAKK